jgi:predicted RNA binding protein YcfA (HicA-like mRNA interferase family)
MVSNKIILPLQLFYGMKYNELHRFLHRHGCTLVRSGGKHDIYYSQVNGRTFAVPRHGSREVPYGTFIKILKDSGINS